MNPHNIQENKVASIRSLVQKYNYSQVIQLSNLFYQAQRSGPLDTFEDFDHDKIGYRRDAALQDGSDQGVDLVGGYFDGNDYIFAPSTISW